MKYFLPTVYATLDIKPEFSTLEEEIEARIKEIVDRFHCQVNTPENKASFNYMIQQANEAILANWHYPQAINGYIYGDNLTIWNRRKLYE